MTTSTNPTTTFEAGRTYTYGFIGDSEAKVPVTIQRRTAKTVWFTERNDTEVKMARVTVYNGVEKFAPCGTGYSMYPTCSATKAVEEVVEVVEVEEVEVVEEEGVQVVEGTEAEVRAHFANEDVAVMEERGINVITNTAYGTLTVDRLFGRKYRAHNDKMNFVAEDRDVFVQFLSTVYVTG